MKKLLILCIGVLLMGCTNNKVSSSKTEEGYIPCSCPECLIYLQPYGNFTKEQVEKFIPELQENFGKYLYGCWVFKILDPLPLPEEAYVKERMRYKATYLLDKQLQQMKNLSNVTEGGPLQLKAVIGLTHKDICTNIHNVENYGIVGLSYTGGKYVGVVSDKRLKDKSQIWKPVMHEFIHAFYNAKHCPNDDPTCFMKDAKGHANFAVQNHLCDSCLQ